MTLSDLQKRTAEAIVNIFETGRALGDYGKVTLIEGDAGRLTYGRSQTTLASGNLYLLIRDYCGSPGCALGGEFEPYLARLERQDEGLNTDAAFRALLARAGDDPTMRTCQDAFFDRVYWQPAVHLADGLGLATALAVAVVYDGKIHGSFERMRDRTIEHYGRPEGDGNEWVQDYVRVRKEWLLGARDPLPRTVYRMEAFERLMAEGAWDLRLPLTVQGVRIDEETLAGLRVLRLRVPAMRGPDVGALQRALAGRGAAVAVDGVFGSATREAVVRFQMAAGLAADGVVGPATRRALRL